MCRRARKRPGCGRTRTDAEAAWPAYEHKSVTPPYARKTHGGRSHAFLFANDFEKKESGPDISAQPAYIRGANDRIRTGDLRFTRALLYQLSHVGTRLLAKREYELYRRSCRFARGKCNFSGERAGIRRFSTGLHPSVAALESRMGTRPIAVAAPPKSCLGAPYRCGVLA